MSLEQIVGACIAVIMAGMPAMVALLKINTLHLAVNSRMDAFITATKVVTEDRFRDLKAELQEVKHRNEQLLDQIGELMKIVIRSSSAADPGEKPPCTV